MSQTPRFSYTHGLHWCVHVLAAGVGWILRWWHDGRSGAGWSARSRRAAVVSGWRGWIVHGLEICQELKCWMQNRAISTHRRRVRLPLGPSAAHAHRGHSAGAQVAVGRGATHSGAVRAGAHGAHAGAARWIHSRIHRTHTWRAWTVVDYSGDKGIACVCVWVGFVLFYCVWG